MNITLSASDNGGGESIEAEIQALQPIKFIAVEEGQQRTVFLFQQSIRHRVQALSVFDDAGSVHLIGGGRIYVSKFLTKGTVEIQWDADSLVQYYGYDRPEDSCVQKAVEDEMRKEIHSLLRELLAEYL